MQGTVSVQWSTILPSLAVIGPSETYNVVNVLHVAERRYVIFFK